eukprot:126808-Chlamydomonas_euryale.AAC.1
MTTTNNNKHQQQQPTTTTTTNNNNNCRATTSTGQQQQQQHHHPHPHHHHHHQQKQYNHQAGRMEDCKKAAAQSATDSLLTPYTFTLHTPHTPARCQVRFQDLFASYDTDRSGTLELDELRVLVQQLLPSVQEKELQYFRAMIDVAGTGCAGRERAR